MFKDVLNHADLTDWPILGLVLFLTCSAGIVLWVFRRGSKIHYESLSTMILEDETSVQQHTAEENSKEYQNG
ncbi:MAG: cbb3-type cytochrome c oxidase subunit 3 [Fibrobacterales bacterium]